MFTVLHSPEGGNGESKLRHHFRSFHRYMRQHRNSLKGALVTVYLAVGILALSGFESRSLHGLADLIIAILHALA
jgi:hypothetical protein